MTEIEHIMQAITPLIVAALEGTKVNVDVSWELTIQVRDDSPNAKISKHVQEDVLIDRQSGVRKKSKKQQHATDPQKVLQEVKTQIQNRLFTSRIVGQSELKLYFKSGAFTKIEELKNQRSVFLMAAANSDRSRCSDWVSV